MKKTNFKAIVLITLFTMILIPIGAQQMNSVTAGGVTFEWSISDGHMDITLQSPEKGWVSVGFNPSSIMKDAAFYLAYIENGQVYLRDDFGTGRISHGPDTSQGGSDDAVILGGEETNRGTTVRFRIPLDSGDKYDHRFVSGEEIPVLFAHSSRDNFTSKHSGKGKALITFEW
jgi:hypothetical protein